MPEVGLITKRAPIKASTTSDHSKREWISLKMNTDIIMAKKGESLLSMLASARII
jgi:hypothetical protein